MPSSQSLKTFKQTNLRIKFVGKKNGAKPLESFTDGNELIVLPRNQSRSFTHPHAKAILQHAPDLYKRAVK